MRSDFILSCCSTADLPLSYFEERDIHFTCFHFQMGGKEYLDDLGQSIPFDEFYRRIADGAQPTTSQINVQQYVEYFEPFLKAGREVLHIAFSSGLSGSANSARIARETLTEKYPDAKLYIVDSLAASSGYGLLVDKAADLRDSGKSAEEVAPARHDERKQRGDERPLLDRLLVLDGVELLHHLRKPPGAERR